MFSLATSGKIVEARLPAFGNRYRDGYQEGIRLWTKKPLEVIGASITLQG